MTSNGRSHGGHETGMRVARFVFGLVATSIFTGGLFFLPVVAALLWRSAYDSRLEGGGEGGDTASEGMAGWDWSGGGGVGGDGSAETTDGPTTEMIDVTFEAGAGVGGDVVASEGGSTAPKTSGSPGSGGGRGGGSGRGTGSGTGDGSGASVTMYRPNAPDLSGGSGGRGPKCDPLVTGIVKTGPDSWSVERQIIDDYANIKMAKTLISGIERHQNDLGDYDGVQIFGLPCGSPLLLAGLKSGDVIHDINGHEITGIPAGLLAWRKVRNDDVLAVRVTRKGRPLLLTYTLG